MTAFSDDNRTKLIKLLDAETALLIKIGEQTELWSHFLGEGDVDQFSAILDKRQSTIEELDGLHQETEVLMQSYMSVSDPDEEIDRRRIEITGKLQALIKSDQDTVKTVKKLSGEYQKEIRKLSENKRGLGGYKYADSGHTGLFDKKT